MADAKNQKNPMMKKTSKTTPVKRPTTTPAAIETLRQSILKHLETLRIRLSEKELDDVVRDSTENNYSSWQLLERFLAGPANSSRERSIERRLRLAQFPTSASLEAFDWSFNAETISRGPFEELATGEFLARGDNIALVGKSGLGKSHLIQGIGRACCMLGHRVRYVTSAELLEDLTSAAGDKTLPARIRYYRSFDLLIIDEFGFDKLERREYPESPSLLYKVVDARSGRGSTAFVTNVDFSDWTEYLGDPPLVMALLDRVVDNAIVLRFEGKSYRQYRAEQKQSARNQSSSQS
jgi:DNA replication protein DnaC